MKRIGLLPSLALVTAVIIASSCGKLEDRINSLEQRISELEDTRIPSIDEQMSSMQRTIEELKKTDAGLREYISALEDKQTKLETELGKTNAALTEAQKTLRQEMAADKSELSGSVDAAKADVIAQLEAYKTLMSGELETLNGTIAELKAKDAELQKNAEELRGYVDSENGKVRDWADATFATIEQQNRLAETVAGIKTQFETLNAYTMNMDVRITNKTDELSKSLSSLDESTRQQIEALTEKLGSDISALRTELTEAYTKLIAKEITKLETSMKSWVNEQLTGYYTVEQTDAKLDAMRTELVGRMDSDKAYLTTLITNLETATNRKISANASLITGLRGDLTSLSQSVAENAGKIADDAILISQNTAAVSKNGAAIAANTKDLEAVKKIAEENRKLISENSEKLSEMQRLHAALKDSGVEDCVETVLQNTKDIASNATLIVKNAAAIQNNAAAIAQNAADIQALSARLDAARAEIVEAYTAAIAKAINDYDGTITARLASEIAKVEDMIAGLKTEVESVKSRVDALEDRVARLEEIVSQITSISYIPRYADGAERVEYTRNALDIIPGDVTLRFDVHPASAASEIAASWESVLSARAVYTLTKAGAGDFVDLKVKGATAENGVLSVTVSGEGLNKDFVVNNTSSSVVVKVTSAKKNVVSEYVKLVPASNELTFIQYLLNNFDTDGDVVVELSEVETAKEVNISGMNITTLEGVVDKMTGLEKLDCSQNNLSHLNISKNTKLISLNCGNNALYYLDITHNTELEVLNCEYNNIESLDLSHCTRLAKLNVANNKLGKLNIYNNSMIEELLCNDNNLTSLDMSANSYLSLVDFSGNSNLSDVRHLGVNIDGVTWSVFNSGTSSTLDYGTAMQYEDAENVCPSGWRIPTMDEFEILLKNEGNKPESIYQSALICCFSSNGLKKVYFPLCYDDAIYPIGRYWTSLYKNKSYVYMGLYWKTGNTFSFYNGYNGYNSVRCVKDE